MINSKYKRGLDHNYLVIDDLNEQATERDFTVEMIQRNTIKGLLNLKTEKNNDKISYMYEISSLQPLTRLYERMEIDLEALRKIIDGIVSTVDNTNDYMLDDEKLIVLPQYIYVNVENHNIKLMYYEDYNGDIRADFVKLAEFILDKVNHENEKAVMMAYSLFKTVRNDNFTMDSLRKILKENYEFNNCDSAFEREAINDDLELTGYDLNHSETDTKIKMKSKDENKKEQLIGKKKKKSVLNNEKMVKKGGVLGNIFGMIMPAKISEGEDWGDREADENMEYNQPLIISKEQNFDIGLYEQNDLKNNKYIFEKNIDDKDSVKEIYGQTVLLSEEEKNNSGTGYRLKNTDNEKIYNISSFPITIGKIKDCVDIVLNDNSVSRIHAKLYEKAGKIYLKDLGSRNGTYVNNVILTNDEEIYLEDKDEIRIGRVNLVFGTNA